MGVEKTIEFILEQQARSEVNHARTEAALAQSAERHNQTEASLARTEALLRRAIRASVEEARRERARRKELAEELTEEMKRLAAAQQQTEASLKAFIDSMQRGGNGHALN